MDVDKRRRNYNFTIKRKGDPSLLRVRAPCYPPRNRSNHGG